MDLSKHLKRRFLLALIVLLIVSGTTVMATFAWYIYNTNAHTTNVHMAAGAGASLSISNTYDGTYGTAAVLDEFVGRLHPVSTNRIQGGFQKVFGFTNGNENQTDLFASLFGPCESSDYYKTSLFLRTNGREMKVYLSNIGFEDSDDDNPISTAIRIGIVTHYPGQDKPNQEEFIFEINKASNPEAKYNTLKGEPGHVLDWSKDDGSTVKFTPYSAANFCDYDAKTGAVSLKPDSKMLCTLMGTEDGEYGTPVQVDIYIWLEGCDEDCTNNLVRATLRNVSLSFAGTAE